MILIFDSGFHTQFSLLACVLFFYETIFCADARLGVKSSRGQCSGSINTWLVYRPSIVPFVTFDPAFKTKQGRYRCIIGRRYEQLRSCSSPGLAPVVCRGCLFGY